MSARMGNERWPQNAVDMTPRPNQSHNVAIRLTFAWLPIYFFPSFSFATLKVIWNIQMGNDLRIAVYMTLRLSIHFTCGLISIRLSSLVYDSFVLASQSQMEYTKERWLENSCLHDPETPQSKSLIHYRPRVQFFTRFFYCFFVLISQSQLEYSKCSMTPKKTNPNHVSTTHVPFFFLSLSVFIFLHLSLLFSLFPP